MRRRCHFAALLLVIPLAAPGMESIWGQQAAVGTKGPDAKSGPPKIGSYSLVVTTLEPSSTTHWLNPPPTIDVTGGTKLAPSETTGNLTVPDPYTIEDFGRPRQECVAASPQQHGCDALDRTDLMIRDPHTVGYRIVSHGAAVQLRINLQVHDLLPVSHGGPNTEWHAGDVIFVSVPKRRHSTALLQRRWWESGAGRQLCLRPVRRCRRTRSEGCRTWGYTRIWAMPCSTAIE